MELENDREYRFTGVWIRRFEMSLEQILVEPEGDEPALLRKARIEATQSQIEDLCGQMAEYEALRGKQVRSASVGSLEELPDALIKARIAWDSTQDQLHSLPEDGLFGL